MRAKDNVFLAAVVLGVLIVAPQGHCDALKDRLGSILKSSRIKESEFAAYVTLEKSGQPEMIWSHRAEEQMIPASLTKIITAGAVLHELGPSRKLETQLLSNAEIKGGTLKGDLILKGGGDPGFVSETMWFLVNDFKRTSVQEIKGDIIVDESRFDSVRSDESRQSERVDRAFDAPVGAMSFNWNSVNIFVRPADVVGVPAKVFLDPENDEVQLHGQVKTVTGEKSQVNVDRKKDSKGRDVVVVSGSIGLKAKEFVAFKNISSPQSWSGKALKTFLSHRGIQVTGVIKSGKTPADARVLARAESKAVSQMVTDMMKFSNNFVAEMLVKNLAAEKVSMPATLADGMTLLKKYVESHGVQSDRFTLINPSGFTRENRMTAKDLLVILESLRSDYGIFAEALASFPLAGIDGTLKNRMKSSEVQGRVRAKTGLLNGVAGLAGFAGHPDGKQMTFVFMFNGRANLGEDARTLFDQLAAELVK